jgi:hypothetical protein
VVGGGGVDLMLRFWLKKGGDGTKRRWKMKRRQRARLDSMKRMRGTTRQRGDVGRMRGGTGEETTLVGLT